MNLIQNIKAGDEYAFKQLYDAYKVKVYNYFLKKVHCEHDAEDLLQNTFMRLWKYRKSISEEFLIDQHLFHIARTVFIDHTRRANKVQRIQKAAGEFSTSITPETSLENMRIQNILSKMPELRRKAFIFKMEGYSYKEIACKLSASVKSVDSNIARALKQIRKGMLFFFIFIF